MTDFLKETFERLVDHVDLSAKRFLYKKFKLSRLTGLIGPRGVGKTTLMLQVIKESLHSEGKGFYFSADSVYFKQMTLLGYVNELYRFEGYRIFFIDEVHQYKNWSQEIKNLYDSFPDIKIVYSGSSSLELIQGSYDLSRRVKLYHLPGMSFREYLNFSTGENHPSIFFNELIASPSQFVKIGLIEKLMGHFKAYLSTGYYPFIFEEPHTYHERVMRIIEKIIFEDIPNYYDLKTSNLHVFKKILGYIASIPPGELNTNNIAKHIGVAHQTIEHYLQILESVGLIHMAYPFEGGSQYLRKPQKIFLHNTTLFYTLQSLVGEELKKGSLRELYFLQATRDAGEKVFYSKQADYRTADYLFEIGGKNKTGKQLSESDLRGIVIKDDMLSPSRNMIPLSYFGFLY